MLFFFRRSDLLSEIFIWRRWIWVWLILYFDFSIFKNDLSSINWLLNRTVLGWSIQIEIGIKSIHESQIISNSRSDDFKSFWKNLNHCLKTLLVCLLVLMKCLFKLRFISQHFGFSFLRLLVVHNLKLLFSPLFSQFPQLCIIMKICLFIFVSLFQLFI